jgi:hypothetical protein
MIVYVIMKNKKIQKRLQAEHKRAMHERAGAIVLAIATLFGMATVDHQSRGFLREATARTNYAFNSNTSNNSGRENETTRMPVKYDDVLRWQTSSGS